MSDLARMLGNVYGDEAPVPDPAPAPQLEAPQTLAEALGTAADVDVEPVPTRRVAKLPEWADEDVLDQAFAQWVPGPPADAPAVERSMLTELAADIPAGAPVATQVVTDGPASPLDDLYQPMIDPLLAEATAQSALEHAISRGWERGDDDILPGRSGGRSSRRLARR